MTQSSPPKKPQVTLRAAEAKDIPALAGFGTFFAALFGYSMPAADLQDYLESAYSQTAVARDLSNPSISTIVAVDASDKVVGFAQLTRGTFESCLEGCERPVELQRLYVAQDFHGAGVGRMLVERVESMARDEGYVTMWLGVWEENFRAQKVYERMGFGKVGSHDFVMGSCVQTDWILTKRL
jgi:ribosomal protein S18 acetylase RimI-like enzyme